MQEALLAPNSAQLRSRGLLVSPKQLLEMTVEALAGLQETFYNPEPHTELTAEEVKALERGGFVLEPEALGTDDPMARTIAEYAALLESSLTTKETAERLGVAGSRIRQRLLATPRTLFGIRLDSGWRLPLFQFDGNQMIPGVGSFVSRFRQDLHPVSVYHWFTTPSPDLVTDDNDEPVSPRDWLRAGFASEAVESLAASL